jgi:hypothetical protein
MSVVALPIKVTEAMPEAPLPPPSFAGGGDGGADRGFFLATGILISRASAMPKVMFM